MKVYVHARISGEERTALDELKRVTGLTESEIVRRGLQLVTAEARGQRSALELAGESVGRFAAGPRDLSSNSAHLDRFGT
jgi:hypothetical protein